MQFECIPRKWNVPLETISSSFGRPTLPGYGPRCASPWRIFSVLEGPYMQVGSWCNVRIALVWRIICFIRKIFSFVKLFVEREQKGDFFSPGTISGPKHNFSSPHIFVKRGSIPLPRASSVSLPKGSLPPTLNSSKVFFSVTDIILCIPSLNDYLAEA